MQRIKKGSYKNAPNPLTISEVNRIRGIEVEPGSPEFHVKNYFLFMFGNMGMNFFDMVKLKRFQYDGERIKYFRKKTEYQGDYFAVKQTAECRGILNYYLNDQDEQDYIFPILNNGTPVSRIHRVKNDKLGWFNKHMRRLAIKAGIQKDVTRDTWTNIGLEMGIDIRKISAGLGHSSIEVTNKHYWASIQEKILDEINLRIALRITRDRKSRYVYTGKYIHEKHWDKSSSKVKKSHPNSTRLNNYLIKKLFEANDSVLELTTVNDQVTTKPTSKSVSFFDLAARRIKEYRQKGTYSVDAE